MKQMIAAFAVVTFLTAGIATADQHGHAHDSHHREENKTIKGTDAYAGQRDAAENIYAPAMDAMHRDMMTAISGDPDVDFVRGMIPHHQGAVEMAKILKANGKDPELQKLADDIIAAQEREISFMQDWLKRKGQ